VANTTKKTKRDPIIAVAQIHYFDTPEKHNVEKIKKFIKLAAKKGADIVCFPETCVHKTNFLKIDDDLIKQIRKACQENNIWAIITDAFEKKGTTYKMSILIDRSGKIKGDYQKINLCDDSGAKPGSKIFTYQTDFAKIGIVICWDLAFPELFHQMKKAGAEIVFCPSYWFYEDIAYSRGHQAKERQLLKSLLISRSFENLFFVVYASPYTKEPGLVSYSAIVGPHRVIKDIKNKEGLIVQKINLREIKKFTRIYPNKK